MIELLLWALIGLLIGGVVVSALAECSLSDDGFDEPDEPDEHEDHVV